MKLILIGMSLLLTTTSSYSAYSYCTEKGDTRTGKVINIKHIKNYKGEETHKLRKDEPTYIITMASSSVGNSYAYQPIGMTDKSVYVREINLITQNKKIATALKSSMKQEKTVCFSGLEFINTPNDEIVENNDFSYIGIDINEKVKTKTLRYNRRHRADLYQIVIDIQILNCKRNEIVISYGQDTTQNIPHPILFNKKVKATCMEL